MTAFGLATLLLAGCSAMSSGKPGSNSGSDAPAAMELLESDLRILELSAPVSEADDLLYQVLVAEFAGVRGQLSTALDAYLLAMELSNDPQLAARATRISVFANQDLKGLQAATRWVELAPDDASARQAMGLYLLRKGDTARALGQFRELVLRADDPGTAFAQLGGGLGREQNQQAALSVLRTLATDFASVPEAHLVYAQAQLRGNDPLAAVSAAEAGLRQAPEFRALATLRAQALVEAGRVDAGIQAFQAIIARYPEDGELRLYLARTLLDARREQEALAQFRRVLLDRPDDAAVLYATGVLTLEAGHPEMAEPYFLRLLELGERADQSYLLLGQIAEEQGRPEDALGWYERAAGDSRLPANLRRAMVLGELGRVDAARELLEVVRRRYPDESVRSFLIEGEVLRRNRQFDAAVAVFTQALERHAGNTDLIYGRAILSATRKDVDKAEADLRTIIEREPDNANALNALGYTLVDLTERVEEGFALIRRAHALEPDNAAVIDSMGWAHFRLGNNAKALDYLRRAYALMPDGEVAGHLGEVLWVMGEREEARRIWREALDNAPDDPTLLDTMQRLDP